MRSSASTRSPPPEAGIPLLVDRVGDDHLKACTGHRLLERGLASPPQRGRSRRSAPVLLDPHAELPLSRADSEAALRGGLLAIDCSWNGLARRGAFPSSAGRRGIPRRLPFLLAANPQHFGRLAELNTAEALAAGLFVLGEESRAQELIAGFPGGRNWYPVNRRFLDAYRAATSSEGIRAAERLLFG